MGAALTVGLVAWLIVRAASGRGPGLVTDSRALVLLVAALLIGEAARAVHLPRLWGWLAVGLASGPAALGLLPADGGAGLLRDAALALVAFGVGRRLDLARDRGAGGQTTRETLWRATRVVGLFGVGLAVGVVGLAVGLYFGFGDVAGFDSPRRAGALGLVLAAVALVPSPLALGSLLGRGGDGDGQRATRQERLTALGVAVVVLATLAGIVGVRSATAFAEAVLLRGGDGLGGNAMVQRMVSLVVSTLLGVGLGAALAVDARWLRARARATALTRGLGLTNTVLAGLVLGPLVAAEPLVTFLVAGIAASTLGPPPSEDGEEALPAPLDARLGLPALVFFALWAPMAALPPKVDVVVVGVAFMLVRAAALSMATRLATEGSDERGSVRRRLWTVPLAQGALALELLHLAAEDLAMLSAPLLAVGAWIVVLDLGAGTWLARRALRLEAGRPLADRWGAAVGVGPDPERGPDPDDTSGGQPLETAPSLARALILPSTAAPADAEAQRTIAATRLGLEAIAQDLADAVLVPRFEGLMRTLRSAARDGRRAVQAAAADLAEVTTLQAARRVVLAHRRELAHSLRHRLEDLPLPAAAQGPSPIARVSEQVEAVVRRAPAELELPLADRHRLPTDSDPWTVRLGKDLRRLTPRRSRRIVPYRRLVRREIGGELIARLAPMEDLIGRAGFAALRRTERVLRGHDLVFDEALRALAQAEGGAEAEAEAAVRALEHALHDRMAELKDASDLALEDVERLTTAPAVHLAREAARALDRVVALTDRAGTFLVSEQAIRFAVVAPHARAAVELAATRHGIWQTRQEAARARLALWNGTTLLKGRIRKSVVRESLGPALRLHGRVAELLEVARDVLRGHQDALAAATWPDPEADVGGATGPVEATADEAQGRPEPKARAAARVAATTRLRAVRVDSDTGVSAAADRARALGEATRELGAQLAKRVERPLEGVVVSLRSGPVVDRLLRTLSEVADPLPERMLLMPDSAVARCERGAADTVEPQPIEVRQTARTYFDETVVARVTAHMRALETSAEAAQRTIRDVERLVAFQLDDLEGLGGESTGGGRLGAERLGWGAVGAGRGARVGAEEAEALAKDGLERALKLVGKQLEAERDVRDAVVAELRAVQDRAVEGLWGVLEAQAADPTVERTVRGVREGWRALREWLGLDRRLRPVHEALASAAALVGAPARADRGGVVEGGAALRTGPARIREALERRARAVDALPYVYGKLFTLGPVENPEFIVGRDAEFDLLCRRLLDSHEAPIAVVGEPGSGRTSLIGLALQAAPPGRRVVRPAADRSLASPDDVWRWLASALGLDRAEPAEGAALRGRVIGELGAQGPIVVVDPMEALLHRSHDGLAALEALAEVIVATASTVQWVVAVERQTFGLLGEISPLARLFADVVRLRPLGEAALEQAILRRHRLSSLDLQFAPAPPPAPGLVGRLLGRALAALRRGTPERRVFRMLAERSRGNPRTALLLWAESLRPDSDDTLVARQPPPVREPSLADLDEDVATALAVVYQQRVVDGGGLRVALGTSRVGVGSALRALEAAGLLTRVPRAGEGEAWALPYWAEAAVEAELERRGLLHARTGPGARAGGGRP